MEFKIHHIAIQAGDLEESLHFYQEVLGLSVIKRELSPKGRTIVWLNGGACRIELYGAKGGQVLNSGWDPDGVGPLCLGLIVSDLDLAVRTLQTRNIPIKKHPYEPVPGERAAMISGPDGEEIVLLEKPVDC